MGTLLRRARAAPSARFGFRIGARSARELLGAALRAGTGPLWRVAKDASRPKTGRKTSSLSHLHLNVTLRPDGLEFMSDLAVQSD